MRNLDELLKDGLLIFRGNADAGIGHGKDHRIAGGRQRGRDPDVPLLGKLEGIGEKIAQDLRDLAFVAGEEGQGLRLVKDQGDAVRQQERAQHAAESAEEVTDGKGGGRTVTLPASILARSSKSLISSESASAAVRI